MPGKFKHEDHHQCGSGTGQPVADQGKMEPKTVFGAESTRRPDPLQRAGPSWSLTPTACSSRKWRWSPGWGSIGWREERRERSKLDVDQRHQKTQDENARAGWLWMTWTQLYLEPRSAQCVLTRKCAVARSNEVYSVYTSRRVQWVASDWTRKRN